MNMLLFAVMASAPVPTFSSPDEAAEHLSAEVRTGTLLFSEGDCLAVKAFTGSPYTHVAGVVVEDGEAWVYDSQNGVGVRKLKLAEYVAVTRPDELHLLQPTRELPKTDAFVEHLEDEIGRPYSVAHHVTGRRCGGVHCAEYMTDSLSAAGLVRAKQPPRVSPASLRNGLLKHGLYEEGPVLAIVAPEPEREPDSGWCRTLWLDTKDCCASCWGCVRRCVFCR